MSHKKESVFEYFFFTIIFKVPLKSKYKTHHKHLNFACIFQPIMHKVINYGNICSFKHTEHIHSM